MNYKVKTIGVLRFSVLTPTYYAERFDSLEKTAAHLFSPDRMALRFRLFEQLCLPSLIRQSDPDFDAVVLTAESMPSRYMDRLCDLLAPFPNIHCRPVGTDKHFQLLKAGYNSIPVGDATHRALFRLDDDDAVDTDFIGRTKLIAQTILQMQGADIPFIIAYNRGFYVRATPDGNEIFDACEHSPLSTGTTLVAPLDHVANPYRFNHRKLAQHYNTFSDISVPGFIRTIHGDNKSNPQQMGLTHKMKPRDIDKQLRLHFDTSLDQLKAL